MSNRSFHYLLTNRPIRFNPKSKQHELDVSNNHLDRNNDLYFGLYALPEKHQKQGKLEHINTVNTIAFTGSVSDQAALLPEGKRDVLLYIHGYDAFPNLKLELLEKVHEKYVQDYASTIGKIIFFSWPSHGFRKKIDDRANQFGQELFQHFPFFRELSRKLSEKNARLHLLVHSFGHQLLNGLVCSEGFQQLNKSDRKIFDQIFLMAPDVPRGCINTAQNGNGISVPNRHGNPKERLYNFTLLDDLGTKTHVFYDEHDYMLYLSSKYLISRKMYKAAKTRWITEKLNLNSEREKYMQVYHILGSWGADQTTTVFENFQLHNINLLEQDQELVRNLLPGRSALPPVESSARKNIEKLKKNFNYILLQPGLKVLIDKILIGEQASTQWINRHRYFISGDIVVLKVASILKTTQPKPVIPTDVIA